MKQQLSNFHVLDCGPGATPRTRTFQVWAEASDSQDTGRVASAYICSASEKRTATMIADTLNSGSQRKFSFLPLALQTKLQSWAGFHKEEGAEMNTYRAAWAEAAARYFAELTGLDYETDQPATAVSDLLGDLMHYCTANGIAFNDELDRAAMHYHEEIAEAEADEDAEPPADKYSCSFCEATFTELQPLMAHNEDVHHGARI